MTQRGDGGATGAKAVDEGIVGRRAVVVGAAWAAPVVAMAVAAPMAAASGEAITDVLGLFYDGNDDYSIWDVSFATDPIADFAPQLDMFLFSFNNVGAVYPTEIVQWYALTPSGYTVRLKVPVDWGTLDWSTTGQVTVTIGSMAPASGPLYMPA
ncbi:MAG: hypothetical protein QM606_01235 [Leucobacter sp.]